MAAPLLSGFGCNGTTVSLPESYRLLGVLGEPPQSRLGTKRRKWKDKEEEILRDIEPIVLLTKEILHPDRSVS
ncbi:hypothetical protein CRYUN_Cryun30bG0038400 [Craigia yunnanensis]